MSSKAGVAGENWDFPSFFLSFFSVAEHVSIVVETLPVFPFFSHLPTLL